MAHVRLPFGIHQAVEYLLGLAVIAAGVRSDAPLAMVVIGVVLVAVPATADGPLMAVRWVPRPAHRVVDVVVAVALLAVVVLGTGLGTSSRSALAAVVVAYAVMAWRVDYRRARPLRRIALTAQDVAGSQRSEDLGRRAGGAVGTGVLAGRRAAGRAAVAGSRGLGRAAGAGLRAYRRRKDT